MWTSACVSPAYPQNPPSRDSVPVNVDAIVFWLVWNAEKSQ
jgi:hypothetical protein